MLLRGGTLHCFGGVSRHRAAAAAGAVRAPPRTSLRSQAGPTPTSKRRLVSYGLVLVGSLWGSKCVTAATRSEIEQVGIGMPRGSLWDLDLPATWNPKQVVGGLGGLQGWGSAEHTAL